MYWSWPLQCLSYTKSCHYYFFKDTPTFVGFVQSYWSNGALILLICCFLGTDISIWHGKTGKLLGNVDTNQLKNNMAAISPNGRFLAAAAFTADVKVNIADILSCGFDNI